MFLFRAMKLHANIAAFRGRTKKERREIRARVLNKYGNNFEANSLPSPALESTSSDIIFLVGVMEGESKRYRVLNVEAALSKSGWSVQIMQFQHIGDIKKYNLTPKIVVIFRAPDEPSLEKYFSYARKAGIHTIYDVDDLVFEPKLVDSIFGYRLLSPQQQSIYRDGVTRYRSLLQRCDAVTVPTISLARAAAALGKPTHVIPNTWNNIQLEVSNALLSTKRSASNEEIIGYFSGSRTHERDFQEAAPALLRLLRERPQLRLRIVGELGLGSELEERASQIEQLPFMPYPDMLRVLFACDINIAPLELNNPFNEAKSELKWFEAALVNTPTVASSTEPFRIAIRDGINGFLATTEVDWHEKLLALLNDKLLRNKIGKTAREDALIHYGPERLLEMTGKAFNLPMPPSTSTVPTRKDAKRIDWIVPGLLIGGGGHRNILRAAYFLEKFGHDVGLIFTNTDYDASQLRALLHQHFYPFSGPIRRYDGVFRLTDALFATHWSTVEVALKAKTSTREIFYFVQDYEPLFAPMGTEYILAENTYRKGLYSITSGPWCEVLLKKQFGAQADSFEFPIDREVYHPRPRTKHDLNVLYFAKPEMPRRCYELGVMMLRELHRLMPDLDIIFYGSKDVNVQTLDFPVTLQGVLPTIQDLAQAYSNADLGIVFSTTNPSLVPYEMMACGTPVVDLDRPGNEINYGGRRDIALLGDPDPLTMAQQVRELLLNKADRLARSKAGLEFVESFPDEEQMARRVEELILARLKNNVSSFGSQIGSNT